MPGVATKNVGKGVCIRQGWSGLDRQQIPDTCRKGDEQSAGIRKAGDIKSCVLKKPGRDQTRGWIGIDQQHPTGASPRRPSV
jgi:hypothetical protein